jgi:hypothetical protein
MMGEALQQNGHRHRQDRKDDLLYFQVMDGPDEVVHYIKRTLVL